MSHEDLSKYIGVYHIDERPVTRVEAPDDMVDGPETGLVDVRNTTLELTENSLAIHSEDSEISLPLRWSERDQHLFLTMDFGGMEDEVEINELGQGRIQFFGCGFANRVWKKE
jgi:hypothetical protein